MALETTIVTAPPIIQKFNAKLLSSPMPEFRDSLKKLWSIYLFIKKKLIKRAGHSDRWKKECEWLEKRFLDLYERTKTKEENLDPKARNKAKEPFYYIDLPDKSSRNIFFGLRKSGAYYTLSRQSDNDI